MSLAGQQDEAEKAFFEAARRAVYGRDWAQEAETSIELLGAATRAVAAARRADRAMAELAVTPRQARQLAACSTERDIALDPAWRGTSNEALRRGQRAEALSRRSLSVASPAHAGILAEVGARSRAWAGTRRQWLTRREHWTCGEGSQP